MDSIRRHAERWWPAAIFIAFVYVVGPNLYNRIQVGSSVATKLTHTPTSPTKTDCELVDVNLDDLMDLYNKNMSMQADKLVDPYIGKCKNLTVQVRDIWIDPFPTIIVSVGGLKNYNMRFGEQWKEKISVLSRNQEISARCQIRDVSSFLIHFQDCELLGQK
jgi:hypothetical protein